MKIIRKLVSNTNFWPTVIVIFFGLVAAKGIMGPGYFNMHDDLQMMRQLEMEKCFTSGQIPCRWVPDMGYGFGFPLFNYYPPLPYLAGEVIRIFGVSFVDTVKLVFILAFVLSGITMYFLSKEFFGKWGGIISAIFYIWAPYHSVDIYVRGAMNEAWALIFFPVILWTGYKVVKSDKKYVTRWIIGLALSWVGLLLSHNLMALIFGPVFAGWSLIWILKDKKWKSILHLVVAGILALGLAAFFTLPVTLEQGLVQTDSLIKGYYEFSTHFATIRQLLTSRFWGYGPSIWEANDGMSFQVGWVHWIVPSIIAGAIIVRTLKTKQSIKQIIKNQTLLPVIFFFVVGWFSVFMIHNKSTFIWTHISTLKFVQFPWRFLTIVIFSFSFIAGSVMQIVKNNKTRVYLGIFLVAAVLLYSWDYFLPLHGQMGALTDEEKFTGVAWQMQQTAGIYDYLPKTAVTAPKAPMKALAEILDGKGEITNVSLGTNKDAFDINLTKNSEIRLGIFKFPEWKVFVDGQEVDNFVPKDEEWGRMHVNIPAGQHKVEVKLFDTPIRSMSNIISIVSWVGLFGFIFVKRRVLFV